MYSSHSNPSFSSTLLDEIYSSIGNDETCGETRRKHNMVEATTANGLLIQIRKDQETDIFDQRVSGKVAVREENYISSSWDSSCDTFYGKRLKPIRVWDKKLINLHEKNQDGFSDKDSPALGLKKVKQPTSPGAARLVGFLNSLFKKPTIISNPDIHSPISKSADSSTCSSASSFSRSCLSKTPSCRGKPNGGEKRSVRFSPVSVILNQNSQSCGNKSSPKATKNKIQKLETVKNCAFSASNIDEQMLLHAKEMNKKVEEAARDLLRNYHKKMDCEFPFGFRKSQNYNQGLDEESEEDDDAASYASSDLFELENLSAIGMESYELPVYETTRLVVFP